MNDLFGMKALREYPGNFQPFNGKDSYAYGQWVYISHSIPIWLKNYGILITFAVLKDPQCPYMIEYVLFNHRFKPFHKLGCTYYLKEHNGYKVKNIFKKPKAFKESFLTNQCI